MNQYCGILADPSVFGEEKDAWRDISCAMGHETLGLPTVLLIDGIVHAVSQSELPQAGALCRRSAASGLWIGQGQLAEVHEGAWRRRGGR